MPKASKYGNLPTETNELVVAAEGLNVGDYRLIVWMIRYIKRGDRLASYEHTLLLRWIEENGLVIEPKDAFTVQFTERQAGALFGKGGDNKTAGRKHIHNLLDHGLIIKVGSRSKGHAQLYALKRCFAAAAIDRIIKADSLVVIADRDCGHSKPVCGHSDHTVSCSDASYPINPLSNPVSDGLAPSEWTGEPPKCPRCGSETEQVQAGRFCPRCETVFK